MSEPAKPESWVIVEFIGGPLAGERRAVPFPPPDVYSVEVVQPRFLDIEHGGRPFQVMSYRIRQKLAVSCIGSFEAAYDYVYEGSSIVERP